MTTPSSYVSGVGMTPFGRHPGTSIAGLAARAVAEALSDADVDVHAIGMVVFANTMAGFVTGQESLRGQVLLAESGLQGLPIVNVENACASGASALHLACLAVLSGRCDTALAIGVDKMNYPDRSPVFQVMRSGVDLDKIDTIRARVGSVESTAGPDPLFMDIYAHTARHYLNAVGGDSSDLARVVVKNHQYAADNPLAQYRDLVTVDDVLNAKSIKEPLTLLMCSPFSDGAAAVIVTSAPRDSRSVRIRASALASGREGGSDAVQLCARRAYSQAGIPPDDLDVVEVHDATAAQELIYYDQIGICPPGESVRLIRDGVTSLNGAFPVNTSGGLLTRGHPVAATGCAQVAEIVRQLRSDAGARQVASPRIGMALNVGGYLGPDPAAVAVTILGN